jgi:DNA-binding NarL/FixJ family response regulator
MSIPAATPRIRVAIVEDDARLRTSFTACLESAEGYQFVGAFPDAESAMEQMESLRPDVVLMDINLPGKSGIDCVGNLKVRMPRVQFLMLTVYEDVELIFRSLQAGATGYLLKRDVSGEILEAISALHSGGAPMSNRIARKVVESFTPKAAARTPLSASLSPRELEILEALSQGFAYKEIADRLGIGVTTVRTHIQRVYEKLHVNNRTEAVVKFLGR